MLEKNVHFLAVGFELFTQTFVLFKSAKSLTVLYFLLHLSIIEEKYTEIS